MPKAHKIKVPIIPPVIKTTLEKDSILSTEDNTIPANNNLPKSINIFPNSCRAFSFTNQKYGDENLFFYENAKIGKVFEL